VSAIPKPERSPRGQLPSGTVSFAFTDIEGSTVRWDRDRAAMQDAVRRHDAIMRAAIADHDGYVFKTIGDAFCAAFWRPEDAVAAMLAAQHALEAEDFSVVDGIRVRAAVHTGTADERDGDYFGPVVNRVARLLSIGHGGQLLVTGVVESLTASLLPAHAMLRDLGVHRLKDLSAPEHVFEVVPSALARRHPPLRSLDAHANNLPTALSSFIGRGELARRLGRRRVVHRARSAGGWCLHSGSDRARARCQPRQRRRSDRPAHERIVGQTRPAHSR
jgi:class 3 adenylate cyclase